MNDLFHEVSNLMTDLRVVAQDFFDDMVSALPEHLSMMHACLKHTELTK